MSSRLADNRVPGRNAAGVRAAEGLYDPAFEHDSCGVGFVVRLDAQPLHSVVAQAVNVLVNLEHRGAVGGDRSTGDGAGVLVQIPHEFFAAQQSALRLKVPAPGDYAVGSVFLPTDEPLADRCRHALEGIAEREGCEVLGWREVPLGGGLGELAGSTQPRIRQVFIGRGKIAADAFERKLYVIRRLAEKDVAGWTGVDASQFYLSSLSARTLVYKGLLTGTQLLSFYPDLGEADFASAFALVHQRYSTNTLPTWQLAQPLRYVAHNGEINTLRGNISRMRAREALMKSALLGDDLEKLKPILVETGSDSAVFDNALELLVASGRPLPHAMMMMIPEAWGARFHMSADKRAFYEYHAAFMEPWDGPAAMVFADGRYVGATLDRNGLRPARYTITRDGLLVLASETGVMEVEGQNIRRRGHLLPGKMFLIDLAQRRIVPDNVIKSRISRSHPYRHWVNDNRIELRGMLAPAEVPAVEPAALRRMQHAFGYSDEELRMVLAPMAERGQEAIGSMGNDAALAVLSNRPQLLFAYFKQLFAQVTNPPIDPLREELVMSTMSYVGRQGNLLEEGPQHCRQLKLDHPILTSADMARLRGAGEAEVTCRQIDMLLPAGGDGPALGRALGEIFTKAEAAISSGATLLILTDRNMDADHAPMPVLLAISGLHHHLIRHGLRGAAGIIVETGEAREVIHFAELIGFGANAICPHVAFSTLREMATEGLLDRPVTAEEAADNYILAIKKGLLKTFSRMGISTLRSWFGSQLFEAVGLSRELIDAYFRGTTSRIGGIGLSELAVETGARHARAFPATGEPEALLEVGGDYHVRHGGRRHLWTSEAIYKLQQATRNGDYETFKQYTALIDDQSAEHVTLRSLFTFAQTQPIPLEQVEPVEQITKRFVTAAMSFGSISKQAHETVAIALNRVGGRSNSGEGGEDPARYELDENGDDRRSRTKQIASGRFGVTGDYLIHADELQIKMAQGAKPGEGGQLPGHKVSDEIARVRHTTPGVTLISPPPHHDIYSIEDLAQLIYDLKMANPRARVSVKLVSEMGVGTIASGVAKAKADMVLISGHDGGTGASPLTSIKHTGLPWELGLAETQQSLVANRLRDRIRLQVDGQLKTGRDVAIAALMGGEEFGFGTTVLVCLGCIMMRKCHMNTCPVGVATQDPALRELFTGKPEYVVNFLRFIAEDLREHMARLGFSTLDEMVGRVDLLNVQPAIEHWKARKLDLSAILHAPETVNDTPLRCVREQEHTWREAMDQELIRLARPAIEHGGRVDIRLPVRNVHRAIGATLSGEITRRHGPDGLPDDSIRIELEGSAGQSLGAFLAPGVTITVAGDANDYVGKGLSGGRIVLKPPAGAKFEPHDSVIVGNVVLYGATRGELFVNGFACERFAVRNSGATAVVEGLGDHGCEYMTGGCVVVLGPTGNNFAAGMSGGIAYVYDEGELFDTRCNLDMVDIESVWRADDVAQLRGLIERHLELTDSPRAEALLENWETHLPLFVKVMPIEYRRVLERMRLAESRDPDTVSATEEVFSG